MTGASGFFKKKMCTRLKKCNAHHNKSQPHTVADFLHNKGVKANLVHALIQAVSLVDLPQLLVKHLLLGVRQLRAEDPVVELLCRV